MAHVRTKRKPNTKNIGRMMLSVIFVFALMAILITFSNLVKNKNLNLNISKNNTASAESGEAPWILENTDVLFSPSGDQIFVELASTEDKRNLGLSGKDKLKMYNQGDKIITEGMLFVFDKEQITSFWMKDMNFDLDMIWLNSDFKILHIEKNAKANSYNAKNPNASQFFTSGNTPAKYVLEINGGYSNKMNLKVGDILRMQ